VFNFLLFLLFLFIYLFIHLFSSPLLINRDFRTPHHANSLALRMKPDLQKYGTRFAAAFGTFVPLSFHYCIRVSAHCEYAAH
jgi:hypothetical protein